VYETALSLHTVSPQGGEYKPGPPVRAIFGMGNWDVLKRYVPVSHVFGARFVGADFQSLGAETENEK